MEGQGKPNENTLRLVVEEGGFQVQREREKREEEREGEGEGGGEG